MRPERVHGITIPFASLDEAICFANHCSKILEPYADKVELIIKSTGVTVLFRDEEATFESRQVVEKLFAQLEEAKRLLF